MNKREMLPYGYQSFTGKILENWEVDVYNRIQQTINQEIERCGKASARLLNYSHLTFNFFANN